MGGDEVVRVESSPRGSVPWGPPENSLRLLPPCEEGKLDVYNPDEESSPEANPAGTLIADLQLPEQ